MVKSARELRQQLLLLSTFPPAGFSASRTKGEFLILLLLLVFWGKYKRAMKQEEGCNKGLESLLPNMREPRSRARLLTSAGK